MSIKRFFKKPSAFLPSAISHLLLAICYLLSAIPSLAQSNWADPSGENPAQFKDIEKIFENILAVIFPLGGIAVFIMLIVGGFGHLTAGGDPKATQKAWATITYAIIGLILLVGIWFIMRFIREFTGVEVTKFQIISE